MASHSDIANRWSDVVTGATDKPLIGSQSNSNVYPAFNHTRKGSALTDSVLYSYGSHFELARFVRPRKGAPFFLLNGDTYSVTTSRHQAIVRDAVKRHPEYQSLIVPHSALASAGIDLDSVEPIDIAPERTETTTHTVTLPELVALGERVASGAFGWDDSAARNRHGALTGNTGGAVSQSRECVIDGTRFKVIAYKRGYDYSLETQVNCGACEGTGRIVTTAHLIGSGALVTEDRHSITCQCCNGAGTRTQYGAWRDYDPPKLSYSRNGHTLTRIGDTDQFTYESWRHFLGAALFRATVTELVTRTVAVGPYDSPDWRDADCEDRYWRSYRNHRVTYVDESRRKRTAYFLSAFDSNETHPHYFLCELSNRAWQLTPIEGGWQWTMALNRPTTVDDAIASLAPREVKLTPPASIKRQGDLFAVPASDKLVSDHSCAFAFPECNDSGKRYGVPIKLAGINGSHRVTELVTVTSLDGRTIDYYGRGWLTQDATRSETAHKRVKLDGWHKLLRNTVPLAKEGVTPIGSGWIARGGFPRAWSIVGRID